MNRKESLKISVIGIDGANKKIIEAMGIDKKETLTDFFSTIPPLTPPSWTSILTGVNQGKHGIYGWQRFDMSKEELRLNTSMDVKYPRIFEILDRNKLKSIIINIPLVYPFTRFSELKNTIIVSDWASPFQFIYPSKLSEKYKEGLIDPPHQWALQKDTDEYTKKVYEFLKVRLNIYYELLEKTDWNLFFIVFSETDWLLHKIPQLLEGKRMELLRPVLDEIKKFFIRAKEVSDGVFIISDHGFEIKNLRLSINRILREHHQIKVKSIRFNLLRLIKKSIPRSVLNSLLLSRVGKKINLPSAGLEVNIRKSDAFMIESDTWGVFVKENIPKVMEILREIPQVKQVINSRDLYRGSYTNYAPTLILIPHKGVEFSHSLYESNYSKIYAGNHNLNGVFLVDGETIKEKFNPTASLRVYDFAPTLFHMFDIPIPKDIDGRVIKEIFNEDSVFAKRKIRYLDQNHYRAEVFRRVIKNLRLEGKI